MSGAGAPSIKSRSTRYVTFAVLLGMVAFLAFGAAFPSSGIEAAPEAQTSLEVDIDLTEWELLPTQFEFQQGDTVTFNITNTGRFSHNLEVSNAVQHQKSSTIGAGETTTLEVTFQNSGAFTIICAVPGHAALGMTGDLAVSGDDPAPSEGDYIGTPAMRISPRSGTEVDGTSQEVRVTLHDFSLSAESIGGDNVAGEGHWALFLDDELLDSIGEPSYMLEDLTSGDHEIRVELRNNDGTPVEPSLSGSSSITVADQPVAATTPSVGGIAPGIITLAGMATLGLLLLGSGAMLIARRRVRIRTTG